MSYSSPASSVDFDRHYVILSIFSNIWVKSNTCHFCRLFCVYFKFFNCGRRVLSVLICDNNLFIIIFWGFGHCCISILAYINCQMEGFIISCDRRALARIRWTIFSIISWIKLSFRSLCPPASVFPWNVYFTTVKCVGKWNKTTVMFVSRP